MIEIKRAFQPMTLYVNRPEDLDHLVTCLRNEIREMEFRFGGLMRRDIPDTKNSHYRFVQDLLNRLTK